MIWAGRVRYVLSPFEVGIGQADIENDHRVPSWTFMFLIFPNVVGCLSLVCLHSLDRAELDRQVSENIDVPDKVCMLRFCFSCG